MRTVRKWDSQAEAKVRGKEFRKSDFFYLTRSILLEKIIGALSQGEQIHPSIGFVRKAVELNAVDIAKRSFEKGIRKAQDRNDSFELLYWLELRNQIKRQYRLDLEVPNEHYPVNQALEEVRIDFQLRDLEEKVLGLRSLSHAERLQNASMLLYRLDNLTPTALVHQFEKKRLLSRTELFNGRPAKAIALQLEALKLFSLPLPQIAMVQEMIFLSQLYCDIGEFESSQYWLMKVSQLEPECLREEQIKRELWIQSTMVLAAKQYNFELAVKALEALRANQTIFSTSFVASSFYSGAVTALANEEWSEARKYLGLVREMPKKSRPRLTWQLEWVRCVLDLEEGKDIESAVRAMQRIIKRMDEKYPSLLLRMAKEIFKNPEIISSPEAEKWRQELSVAIQDGKELRCSFYFDGIGWLESKVRGETMAEYTRTHHLFESEAPGSFAFA